jgi:hydroxypyruvate reductase
MEIRAQLERWFAAGVAAVDPLTATRRAIAGAATPTTPPAIIAIGKAATGMAAAAVEWLGQHDLAPIAGLLVTHQPAASPHPALPHVTGDHPVPGPRSFEAAAMLAETIAALPPATPVHVLLSGGASSLIGAPLNGIDPHDLIVAFERFHSLGLDIATMNGLRRRLTRWSGGRLAAALGSRPVQAWVISDVIGNDLAVIGSGPLVATSVDLENVRRILAKPAMVAGLPAQVRAALAQHDLVEAHEIAHHIVADAATAAHGAAEAATTDGIRARFHHRAIVGDAEEAGAGLARWIHAEIDRHRLPDPASGLLVRPVPREPVAHVWVSETTVSLPGSPGQGGRAQQFALSAARGIADLGWPGAATVLIAGTDGRDGPTDAAGAIVDAGTVARLRERRIDVDATLTRCDAYPALDQVGALLRTGTTGTNVADLVMVWMWNWY